MSGLSVLLKDITSCPNQDFELGPQHNYQDQYSMDRFDCLIVV